MAHDPRDIVSRLGVLAKMLEVLNKKDGAKVAHDAAAEILRMRNEIEALNARLGEAK
jgi:hypothetical protein